MSSRIQPNRRKVVACVSLVTCAIFGLISFQPASPYLLDRSTRVHYAGCEVLAAQSFRWISGNEAVFAATNPPAAPLHIKAQESSLTSARPFVPAIISPPGRRYEAVGRDDRLNEKLASPNGRRFAWTITHFHRPPLFDRLRGVYRLLGEDLVCSESMSLCVSNPDGSDMVELGRYKRTKAFTQPMPHSIAWMPDGKHISFVHNNALYAISVDGS